jgi:hypothetical protein
MAGFDSSLTEEERRLLADYVVTLGPPVEEVQEADMILAVHDRPVVVRGLLPALGEGLSTHPRGMLIGDPSGITFEYRVDDVRLLALRQGGFVKRTDWSGRGGTPLEPLGKAVHLVEGGKPEATFFRGATPLVARLSGTEMRNAENGGCFATLQYHLLSAAGELGHVMEVPLVRTESIGTGYSRTFDVKGTSAAQISLRTPALSGAELLASGSQPEFHEQWQVVRTPSGPPVFQLVISYGKDVATRRTELGQLEATIALEPGSREAKSDMKSGFDLWELVLVDWNEQVRADLARWYEDF